MPTGLRAMPILGVTDPEKSAAALAGALGFEVAGFWRDADAGARFGILRLGSVTLGLKRVAALPDPVSCPVTGPVSGPVSGPVPDPAGPDAGPAAHPDWAAYLYVDDVAAIADLARAANMPTDGPLETPYGTREVEVEDRDGNVICFAEDLAPGPDGPGL